MRLLFDTGCHLSPSLTNLDLVCVYTYAEHRVDRVTQSVWMREQLVLKTRLKVLDGMKLKSLGSLPHISMRFLTA